jgi:segregation and condensation protein A
MISVAEKIDSQSLPVVNEQDPPTEADLVLRLGAFDGPLDLLLSLAHEQKVDLAAISINALAEQYLAYIAAARKLRLEIAADYLVMAAWLAYLKSKLLLPEPPQTEPDPAQMAGALRFQLQRLEAMRQAAQQLQDLPQLGYEVLARGVSEVLPRIQIPVYHMKLHDLLQGLVGPQRRSKAPAYAPKLQKLMSLEAAMGRVRNMIGFMPDWSDLAEFIPELIVAEAEEWRSAVASTFAASLELAKSGEIVLRQDQMFGPIFIRKTGEEIA